MMRIRPEQVAALDGAVKDRFYVRLAAMLREQFPPQTEALSQEALLARVRASGQAAAQYGVTSERGVARFATLALVSGEEFHTIPLIRRELRRGVDAAERFLEALLDSCAREVARRAEDE